MTPGDGTAAGSSGARGALYDLAAVKTLAEGLDHPEGIALGPDGDVYAGGEAGQIYRLSGWAEALAAGGTAQPRQIAGTGGFVLGLALDAGGTIYACDLARREVVRVTPGGAVSVYTAGAPEAPLRTPNYPVFDAAGRLYVSDSGAWDGNDGLVYVVEPRRAASDAPETRVASTAPHRFPNGLALTPDGKWLYVAESTLPGVTRLPVGADGSLGALEEVARLPGTVPDGLAFDVAGNLYVACYRPDRLYRVTPDGAVAVLAEDPRGTALAAPTNVAFLGGSRLGIASLGRWHLAALEVDTPGAPLYYPRVP
jgi:gluconolactonase